MERWHRYQIPRPASKWGGIEQLLPDSCHPWVLVTLKWTSLRRAVRDEEEAMECFEGQPVPRTNRPPRCLQFVSQERAPAQTPGTARPRSASGGLSER